MFKKKILICMVVVLLSGTYPAWADTVWDSGHHDILDSESYHEIWLLNDATADMWGGDVFQLGALDSSRFDMFAGTMNMLMVRYNSIVNIYGGTLSFLHVYPDEDGLVNLYAYDVVYHPPGGWTMDGWKVIILAITSTFLLILVKPKYHISTSFLSRQHFCF
jgi:hypothetical protein